ncbi:hypothetical protein Q604_UNBC08811G0001, partial [human gut metagenome]
MTARGGFLRDRRKPEEINRERRFRAVYDLSSDYVQYVPAKRVWFPVPATM